MLWSVKNPTRAALLAGKGTSKPSSAAKRQQPKRTSQPAAKPKPASQVAAVAKAQPAMRPAATAKPQSSFSRKRPLESSQQAEPRQARPSKQQRPAAEALFDSLFDDEQENGAAAVAPQVQPPKPAVAAAAATRSGKGTPDLAAKVQARLEKHRARFTRRRTASQRQLEDEE